MSFKKLILVFLIGGGLIACSSDDNDSQNEEQEGSPTYVTLSLSLSGNGGTKALPEDSNPDGDYEGVDGIVTLDVYMLGRDKSFEAKRFTGTNISSTGLIVSTSEPFRTISGTKTVYVVINSPNPLLTTGPTDDLLLDIAGLAKRQTTSGTTYDVITMTGKSAAVYIAPDVSPQEVADGANQISIQVMRVASRVIVTSTASPNVLDDNGVKVGTVSNVTYSIAQGANKVYFLGKADYSTWGSAYVPTTADIYATDAVKYYDYSDLATPTAVPVKPTAADGYKSLPGKFLFENTHTSGDVRTSLYKKGNTAYILVRAKYTPEPSAIADGGALVNGTFYVGETDGKIYSTKAKAQAAVQNQKVSIHENGKMLQYAWLNPDDLAKPINSPVVRNNIYHINITGFKRVGFNWNPLDPNADNPDKVPGDPAQPTIPVDPTDPLTPEQTYMTVDVSVLNWTVHSYDIEF